MFLPILNLNPDSTRRIPLLYPLPNLLLPHPSLLSTIGTSSSYNDESGEGGREVVELCFPSIWERIWGRSFGRYSGLRWMYYFESCVSQFERWSFDLPY